LGLKNGRGSMEKAMFKMGVNPICGRLNGESIGNLQLFRSWEKKDDYTSVINQPVK